MSDWAKYIGLPFVPMGRDLSGFDCIGLFMFIQRVHFGIDVPEVGVDPIADTLDKFRAFKSHAALGDWRVTDEPREGDAVMMGTGLSGGLHGGRGIVGHIGIYICDIGGDGVLHCDDGLNGRGGSVIFTRLGSLNIAESGREIVRFLRYCKGDEL